MGRRLAIFGIYAPNEDEPPQIKETFYEELQAALDNVGDNREIIMLGDFNARVGCKIGDKVVGKFGEIQRNDNGEKLIDLCTQNNLKITNGFFEHKHIHRYTWTQPTRKLKTIIDYVITGQTTSTETMDVRVSRGAECGSDHHLLKAKFYFPYKSFTPKQEQKGEQREEMEKCESRKYNLENFKEESIKYLYQQRLDQKLKENVYDNIEQLYEHIKNALHEAAHEALGKIDTTKKVSKKIWWNEEIEQKVKEKKDAYLKWLNTKSDDDRQEYVRKRARVKKVVTEEKKKTWDRKCSEIEMYIGGKRCTEAWKFIDSIRTDKKKVILEPISGKDWEDYYSKLLVEDRENFKKEGPRVTVQGEPIEIQIENVEKAIKNMKNRKASGPGDITAEMLKNGTEKMRKMITILYNKCINEGTIPKEWKLGYMSSIHKKGDPRNCGNYRGITVTSTFSRVYGRVLRELIEEEYSNQDAEEQSGFRAGRSCTDNLFCLKQIMEKKINTGRSIHLLFIDLAKAYDNVPVSMLWEAMEETNINNVIIKTIQELYKDTTIKIKTGERLSKGFTVTKGLKQGCCLSPTLFKIYIEYALKNWKKKCSGMGIQINDKIIYTLQFADDQVLLAQDKEDLEYMTRKIKEEYEKAGLSMNVKKTRYLCVGEEAVDLDLENGEKIAVCDHYKYLGVRIEKDGRDEKEIRERIGQGRRAIKRLNGIWWNKEISKRRKYNIYNTIVKSIVLYGAEVWRWNEADKRRVAALEMDALRRSCRISRMERIPNERIKQLMEVKETIVENVEKKQLIWYGHVRRMGEDRLPRATMEWIPPERRKRGRPRTTWGNIIRKAMSERNLQDEHCQDRQRWRKSLEIGQRRQTL